MGFQLELLRIRVIAVLGYWFGRNNDGELARCRRTILLKRGRERCRVRLVRNVCALIQRSSRLRRDVFIFGFCL